MLYWHVEEVVEGIILSAVRDDQNRHFGPGDSRAEIQYRGTDGLWQEIWTGPPTLVEDVLQWAICCLRDGASIEEVDGEILESPWKYGVLGYLSEEQYISALCGTRK